MQVKGFFYYGVGSKWQTREDVILEKMCLQISLICGRLIPGSKSAGVAEWQTHQTQNLTRVTSCGFKSHLLHVYENGENTGCKIPVFSRLLRFVDK